LGDTHVNLVRLVATIHRSESSDIQSLCRNIGYKNMIQTCGWYDMIGVLSTKLWCSIGILYSLILQAVLTVSNNNNISYN